MWKRFQLLTASVKRDALVLWLAARDPRTPWRAKLPAGLAAAYVLSPLQLLPNFIPLVGYLDDLLVVIFGIRLALRHMPSELIVELRQKAQAMGKRPRPWTGAVVVIVLWIAVAALGAAIIWRPFQLRGSP